MSLTNQPGTLNATRYAGSPPIGHPASKINTGTLGRPRTPLFQATPPAGTSRGIGTLFKPSGTFARYVHITMELDGDPVNGRQVILTQTRQGTLGRMEISIAQADFIGVLSGIVLSDKGSYHIRRNLVTPNIAIRSWQEYDLD